MKDCLNWLGEDVTGIEEDAYLNMIRWKQATFTTIARVI